jgi:hypothetical protein
MRMPDQGLRLPVKNCGNLTGRMTASLSASLAPSRPATSSHLTFGFSVGVGWGRVRRGGGRGGERRKGPVRSGGGLVAEVHAWLLVVSEKLPGSGLVPTAAALLGLEGCSWQCCALGLLLAVWLSLPHRGSPGHSQVWLPACTVQHPSIKRDRPLRMAQHQAHACHPAAVSLQHVRRMPPSHTQPALLAPPMPTAPDTIALPSCPLSLSRSLSPPSSPPPLPFCAVAPAPFAAAAGAACCPLMTPLRYSARSRYSMSLALMASALRGFFSYLRCAWKYSRAAL